MPHRRYWHLCLGNNYYIILLFPCYKNVIFCTQFLSLHAVAFPVYLSLSGSNYLSGFSKAHLSSVGEGGGGSLVCHMNLNASGDGQGNWYYPNGSLVTSEGEWYVTRGDEMVSLNRRTSAQTPGGLYCCVVPTDDGTHTACIVLGKDL